MLLSSCNLFTELVSIVEPQLQYSINNNNVSIPLLINLHSRLLCCSTPEPDDDDGLEAGVSV